MFNRMAANFEASLRILQKESDRRRSVKNNDHVVTDGDEPE
ncbi:MULTISPECIES: hypothetical protein [Bradyrhizobium]|nr:MULTISPECIES: hypothetical protein [Bradyrhizobium]